MTRPSTKTLILAKLTVNMSVFAGFAVASICYFQIGGADHLPTERPRDSQITCLSLPSFYTGGACDTDPNT
jgi:hypothetical protein